MGAWWVLEQERIVSLMNYLLKISFQILARTTNVCHFKRSCRINLMKQKKTIMLADGEGQRGDGGGKSF